MHCLNRYLGRDIARLKRLYNTCSRETRPGKKRFAFYDYIYEVYAMHAQWRADLATCEIKRQIAHLFKAPLNADVHVLKLIIDALHRGSQDTEPLGPGAQVRLASTQA